MLGGPNHEAVMAGLVPAIHGSDKPVVEVIPARIRREDQAHLLLSRPVLHVVLALDRRPNVGVRFNLDQPFQPVAFGETVRYAFSVFPDAPRKDAPRKIAGHARIQRAVRAIGPYVDPCALHRGSVTTVLACGNAFVDGRDKPGHDDRVGTSWA